MDDGEYPFGVQRPQVADFWERDALGTSPASSAGVTALFLRDPAVQGFAQKLRFFAVSKLRASLRKNAGMERGARVERIGRESTGLD